MGIGVSQVHFLRPLAPLGRLCTLGAQAPGVGMASADMAEVWRNLGATSVDALDIHAGDGVTIVHDLNEPVPKRWHGAFDTVLDSGTLEHVFDVAAALRNMAAMLRIGGKLICINPANGWLHHGFYQFSPQLVTTFCRAHGFDVADSALYRRGTPERFAPYDKPAGQLLAMVCGVKTDAVGSGNVTQARYRQG